MSSTANPILPKRCEVAIIGSGPSGLVTATELKVLGVSSVIILERNEEAGGIPRHCGHSPFGMREFKRIYSGRKYAQLLSKRALENGVQLSLNTSVIALHKGGLLTLSTSSGTQTLQATRVLICTGTRETPRASRLISGQRPLGITTSGALQSIIYLKGKKPFARPIVVGSELVSFSALLSCRHAGIRPLAMLEANTRIHANLSLELLAKGLGVPIYKNTKLIDILGKRTVSGVQISISGTSRTLDCDGVIFTGKFISESSLVRMSHLRIDTDSGNPVIDQFGRCSDPAYFATGNIIHPVETAGYCWQEGIQTAKCVYASLNGQLDHYDRYVDIKFANPAIKYVVPQTLAIATRGDARPGIKALNIRLNHASKGCLSLKVDGKTFSKKNIRALPERRVTLDIPELTEVLSGQSLELHLHHN